MVRRHVAMTLVVLLVSAIPAMAQTAPLWGELSLLGGAAAARRVFRLGEPDGRLAASVLVDFVRRHSRVANWDGVAARMMQYQSALSLVRDAAQGTPGGIRVPLSDAARDQSNREVPLASALGLERVTSRDGASFVPGHTRDAQERVAWMRAVGIDADAVAASWAAGDPVSFVVPASRLPLPLPAYWASHSSGGPAINAVLRDRRSALLYVALIALDDETLRFLADHPALLDPAG